MLTPAAAEKLICERLICLPIESLPLAQCAGAVLREIATGRLAAVPIEGLQLRRVLARSSIRPVSRASELLIDILHEVVKQEVEGGRWPNAKLLQ